MRWIKKQLDDAARIAEALFTGLRLTAGIDGRNFQARYGVDPWSRHGATLAPFVEDGFMWRDATAFGLTRRGMLVANEIFRRSCKRVRKGYGTVE